MKRGRKTSSVKGDDMEALVGGREPAALHFAKWLAAITEPPKKIPRRGVPPARESKMPYYIEMEIGKNAPQLAPIIEAYPGLIPWRGPLDDLFLAAREGDEALASFLESAARQIRAGLHRKIFVDENRIAMRYIVRQIYPNLDTPVNVSDLVGLLGSQGIMVSEKWTATECRKLGHKIRGRGRA